MPDALLSLEAIHPGLAGTLVPAPPEDVAAVEALVPLRPEHRAFLERAGASTGTLALEIGHARYDTSVTGVLTKLRRWHRKTPEAPGALLGLSATCQDCGPLFVEPGGAVLQVERGEPVVRVADSLPVFLFSRGVAQFLFPRLGASAAFETLPDPALAPEETLALVGERLVELGFAAGIAFQEAGGSARPLHLRSDAVVLLEGARGRVRAADESHARRIRQQIGETVKIVAT